MTILSDRRRLGIAITVLGCIVYVTWMLWVLWVFRQPLSRPFPMSAGSSVTAEFTAHKSSYYSIKIEAQRKLPADVLNCLMGISYGPLDQEGCADKSVINVSWVLMSDGQFVARGSSDDSPGRGGGSKESVERDIGVFQCVAGKAYSLQLTSEADAGILASADPKIAVKLIAAAYEDELEEDSILTFVFLILETIGVTLWVSSAVGKKRRHGG